MPTTPGHSPNPAIDPHVRDEVRRVFGESATFAGLSEAEQDAAIDTKARKLTEQIESRLRDGTLVAPWLSPHGSCPDPAQFRDLTATERKSITRQVLEQLYAEWPDTSAQTYPAPADRQR